MFLFYFSRQPSYSDLLLLIIRNSKFSEKPATGAIVEFIGMENYGKLSYDYNSSLIVFVCDIPSYDDIAIFFN
jgi:hypothetical protein